MDTTKEEILKRHLSENEHHSDKMPEMFVRFLIYNAMQEFAEYYHKQKLNLHGVMQAEGSASALEAAVGQRSVGKKRAGGIVDCTCKTLLQWTDCTKRCNRNQ